MNIQTKKEQIKSKIEILEKELESLEDKIEFSISYRDKEKNEPVLNIETLEGLDRIAITRKDLINLFLTVEKEVTNEELLALVEEEFEEESDPYALDSLVTSFFQALNKDK